MPPSRSGRVGVLIVNIGTQGHRLLVDPAHLRNSCPTVASSRRRASFGRPFCRPCFCLGLTPKGAIMLDLDGELDEGPLQTIARCAERKAWARARQPGQGRRRRLGHAVWRAPDRRASKALQAEGCDRSLVIALCPQYCAASTRRRRQGVRGFASDALTVGVRVAAPYYDEPVSVDALARSVRASVASLDVEPKDPDRLLPRHSASLLSTRQPPVL